jgi:hypothetical protein
VLTESILRKFRDKESEEIMNKVKANDNPTGIKRLRRTCRTAHLKLRA